MFDRILLLAMTATMTSPLQVLISSAIGHFLFILWKGRGALGHSWGGREFRFIGHSVLLSMVAEKKSGIHDGSRFGDDKSKTPMLYLKMQLSMFFYRFKCVLWHPAQFGIWPICMLMRYYGEFSPILVVKGGIDQHIRILESIPPSPD